MIQVSPDDQARLTVARWKVAYGIPTSHPDPEDVRRRLDDMLRTRLAETCAHWLDLVVDPADPSVWRIKELRMDFVLDAECVSGSHTERNFGERLASRIHEVLERDEQNDSVLHFRDRATYLAQFLCDLAAGRAWNKWYYDEFDSLRSLPVNLAIAAAFVSEREIAATILVRLTALKRLEVVLLRVSERQAEEILESCSASNAEGSVASDQRVWAMRLLELWGDALLRPSAGEDSFFRDALRLWARLATQFPGAERSQSARAALLGLLEVRRVLATFSSTKTREHFLQHAAIGSISECIALAQANSIAGSGRIAELLAQLSGGDAHWAVQAAAVLLGDQLRQATIESQGTLAGESIASHFAGVFLLAPTLCEIGIEAFPSTVTRKTLHAETIAATLRHWLLVKCLGRSRGLETVSDAALRLLSGFTGRSFPDALQDLDENSVSAEALQRILLRALLGSGRYDGHCLLVETAPVPESDHSALVVRDVYGGYWIAAISLDSCDSADPAALESLLRSTCDVVGRRPKVLLLRGAITNSLAIRNVLHPFADQLFLGESDPSAFGNALASELNVSPERLAQLLPTAVDHLQYFSLLGVWPRVALDPRLDLTLTLFACAALRQFARRLMGFESSSPEYLYQNFLAGLGIIHSYPEKCEVRLPRSPLFLVLRLCGLHEQTFRVPWIKEREVCLFPSGE